jgi:hypothetical protein
VEKLGCTLLIGMQTDAFRLENYMEVSSKAEYMQTCNLAVLFKKGE